MMRAGNAATRSGLWSRRNDLGSGSFERGGQPRSVPDPDGDAYDEMVRRHAASQTSRTASPATTVEGPPVPDRASRPDYWSRHPGTLESLAPVWGSAREAIADYRNGDKVGALINGAMAVADLTGEGFVGKELYKGGAKIVGSNTWNATRKWMGKKGLLDAGQHGHHWLIPQRSSLPEWLKNQPWNIKGMPGPQVHGRMHGRYAGQPQFNEAQQLWQGTPTWAKTQTGLAAGHIVQGVEEGLTDPYRPPSP